MRMSCAILSRMKKQKPMKLAIAQMNPTVGDYAANTAKILAWIEEAEKNGANLIVFPECALCGYPVWDLANKKSFIAEGKKHLKQIAAATRNKKITLVLGFIDSSAEYGVGRSCQQNLRRTLCSYNAAAWIENGKISALYHKRLLPTYDVFLENIFFEPGVETIVIPWKGYRVGLTICEDIWDDRYPVKPLQELKEKKADFVINISASPYYSGVARVRDHQLQKQTRRYHFPILYVNQVGGQDDLIFDGRSIVCDAKGRIHLRAPAFEEGLFYYPRDPFKSLGEGYAGESYNALVMGIRDYFRKNNFKKAVIGLSGGIDSALVACLAVDALGKDAVKGVTMPGPYSSKGSWKDSEALAKNLGIEFEIHPIQTMYDAFLNKNKTPSPLSTPPYQRGRGVGEGDDLKNRGPSLAMENLQARLRGLELMFISNDEGRLVLTTGNKSELAMGYCTLYGDMAGGLAVIGDVYKTEVYRLARYRNTLSKVIPEPVFVKAPSAELRPNQKDQDSLPPYSILDQILNLYIERNLGYEEIVRRLKAKIDAKVVADTICKVDHNEYKRRQTPPILRVTEKAWFGRRMPITNRFQG